MARAMIGIGANVGDRWANLDLARRLLGAIPQSRLVKFSQVYETAPVGPVKQGDYLNAAAELETGLEPTALLAELAKIEAESGREPRGVRQHWGPRTLDLDILLYDQRVVREESLAVPHPRLHERWFVLRPLADLDPGMKHPVLAKSVGELLAEVEKSGAGVGGRVAARPG
ncbi:MAG: 2-amino-4-hydroxy-6-hydroxymethyldihydropteridine diphosphokinase [Planctomycetota bacterium]|nr:2-amino-4-hydroxy-6-hydroxymethyldihydropteridine diphosphokinase [Planctomycetota bacterium]